LVVGGYNRKYAICLLNQAPLLIVKTVNKRFSDR